MNGRLPIRTLLVEDNPADALLLREALTDVPGAEFAMTHVERLEDALARLAEEHLDVVLLDLGLPDSQGPDTLIRLRRHQPDVPLVVLTGLDDEAMGIRAMQLGAQDYLVKGHFQAPLLGRSLRYAIERHESALAVRKSEARLSGLIGSAMDAIITVDDKQRITLFNPAAEQTFACKASEVLGQTLDRFIPERFRSAHADHLRAFGQTNVTPRRMGELGLIYGLRADGTEFPLEASISQVDVAGNKLFTVILRDITERRRVEEALRRSQRLLAQAEQLARVGAWESEILNREELEKNPLHWSDETCRIFGYEPDALEMAHPLFLHHVYPEDRPRVRNAFRQAVADRTPYAIEHRILRSDGMERTVIEHAEIVLDKSGQPERVIGAVQDITERKRAEAALHLRTKALEAAVNGVVIADRKGTILWANAAVTALTGYTSDELVGKNPRILKSGRHNKAFYRDLWTTILSGQVWQGELVNQRKDGSSYTEEMTITPVRDDTGEITQFIAIKQDVTERSKAQEQIRKLNEELDERVRTRTAELEAANREMEAFTYSVSHDLRAPLRYINGFSDILVDDYGPSLDVRARAHLERVRGAAKNMGRLVDGLLKLSRLGRQALTRRPTALNLLVLDVVEEIKPDLEGREIEWRIGQLSTIECDPDLVRQVFMNLLSNAVKYTRPRQHAVIVVDQTMTEGRPVFFVRDNGVGFDMQYANNLFGVFHRLHRCEEFEGTGVGLASVQSIIHKHGGRVWAVAELDKGATFYFTLGDLTERRRAERRSVERAVTLRIESDRKNTCYDAVTVDLSPRGARVRGGMGLSAGQPIDLITEEAIRHVLPAQVVWVNQGELGRRGEAGLRFVEPTDLPPGLLAAYSVVERTLA